MSSDQHAEPAACCVDQIAVLDATIDHGRASRTS